MVIRVVPSSRCSILAGPPMVKGSIKIAFSNPEKLGAMPVLSMVIYVRDVQEFIAANGDGTQYKSRTR